MFVHTQKAKTTETGIFDSQRTVFSHTRCIEISFRYHLTKTTRISFWLIVDEIRHRSRSEFRNVERDFERKTDAQNSKRIELPRRLFECFSFVDSFINESIEKGNIDKEKERKNQWRKEKKKKKKKKKKKRNSLGYNVCALLRSRLEITPLCVLIENVVVVEKRKKRKKN